MSAIRGGSKASFHLLFFCFWFCSFLRWECPFHINSHETLTSSHKPLFIQLPIKASLFSFSSLAAYSPYEVLNGKIPMPNEVPNITKLKTMWQKLLRSILHGMCSTMMNNKMHNSHIAYGSSSHAKKHYLIIT